jgi:hypothetical protein
VLVIGDSITQMSRDAIATELERDGWAPTIEAQGGSDIAAWEGRAAELAVTTQPAVAVVELGTNQRGDEVQAAAHIDSVMRGLERVGTVLWLDVQEGKTVGRRAIPPDAAGINAALDAAQDRWPNLTVLDFDGFFADRDDLHMPDGVHPNRRGQEAIARYLASALRDIDVPVTTTTTAPPAAPAPPP